MGSRGNKVTTSYCLFIGEKLIRQVFSSLKQGDRGDKGLRGPEGLRGPTGPSGYDGKQGPLGEQGEKGLIRFSLDHTGDVELNNCLRAQVIKATKE